MKLDELVEDVMNLDINKESMDDNLGYSQDQSIVCLNSFNIDIQHLMSSKDIIFLLNCVILFLLNFIILNLVEVYALLLECK